MRKIGKFFISDKTMHDEALREKLGELFNGVIVVGCIYSMMLQGYEYVALSDKFTPVDDGSDGHRYGVQFQTAPNGFKSFEFVQCPPDELQELKEKNRQLNFALEAINMVATNRIDVDLINPGCPTLDAVVTLRREYEKATTR